MKINSSMNKNMMHFDNINDGEVFEANGFYFMKIPVHYMTTGGLTNAVRLENGYLVKFNGADSVRYIDAELVV